MIVPAPERELGLQKEIFAGHHATLNRRHDRLPDGRLVVMPSLVGGIDASKSLLEGEISEPLRFVLFPGSPVQKPGHPNSIDRYRPLRHGPILLALQIPGTAAYSCN